MAPKIHTMLLYLELDSILEYSLQYKFKLCETGEGKRPKNVVECVAGTSEATSKAPFSGGNLAVSALLWRSKKCCRYVANLKESSLAVVVCETTSSIRGLDINKS